MLTHQRKTYAQYDAMIAFASHHGFRRLGEEAEIMVADVSVLAFAKVSFIMALELWRLSMLLSPLLIVKYISQSQSKVKVEVEVKAKSKKNRDMKTAPKHEAL